MCKKKQNVIPFDGTPAISTIAVRSECAPSLKLPYHPKLANMVEACFKRRSETIFFKKDFGEAEQEFSFLKKKLNFEIQTKFRTQSRGVLSA